MKKYTILLLVATLYLSSCKQQVRDKHFTIFANYKGLENQLVYLKKYSGSGYQFADSVHAVDGSFQFTGKVELPELYRIYIENDDNYIAVFVENTDIYIDAEVGKYENAEIKGSISNDLYRKLFSSLDSMDNALKPINEAYHEAEISNNIIEAKKLEMQLDSSQEQQIDYIKAFVKKNNSSPVAAYILYKYLSGELELAELESLSSGLDTALQRSVYMGLINEEIDILKKTQIGQAAVDFSLPDTSGTSVQLSSFKGRIVLVDFWASWCSYCREENPNVVKAFKDFNKKGFTVLGISFDKNRNKWIKAIHADNLTWTHLSDLKGWENAAGQLYGIKSIPSNVLIDKEGIIIAKNLRGKELLDKLKELLQ